MREKLLWKCSGLDELTRGPPGWGTQKRHSLGYIGGLGSHWMRLCELICQQANKQSMKSTLGESVLVWCVPSLLTNPTPLPASAVEPVGSTALACPRASLQACPPARVTSPCLHGARGRVLHQECGEGPVLNHARCCQLLCAAAELRGELAVLVLSSGLLSSGEMCRDCSFFIAAIVFGTFQCDLSSGSYQKLIHQHSGE